MHGAQNHREGPVRQTQENIAGHQPSQEDARRLGHKGQKQDINKKTIVKNNMLLKKVLRVKTGNAS